LDYVCQNTLSAKVLGLIHVISHRHGQAYTVQELWGRQCSKEMGQSCHNRSCAIVRPQTNGVFVADRATLAGSKFRFNQDFTAGVLPEDSAGKASANESHLGEDSTAVARASQEGHLGKNSTRLTRNATAGQQTPLWVNMPTVIEFRPVCLKVGAKKPESYKDAVTKPLLNFPVLYEEDSVITDRSSGLQNVALAVYHKTGTYFARDVIHILRTGRLQSGWLDSCLRNRQSLCRNVAYVANTTSRVFMDRGGKACISVQSGLGKLNYNEALPGVFADTVNLNADTGHFLAIKPTVQWNPPLSSKIVHWIRHPVHLIASTYRYWSEGQEPWMILPLHCNYCGETALQIFSDMCSGRHCSLANILSTLTDNDGVLFTALVLQRQLQDMVDNTRRWLNSSRVLHLTLETLRQQFDNTGRCMLHFIGIDQTDAVFKELAKLDLKRYCRKDAAYQMHGTSTRYSNAEIMLALSSHSAWRNQFLLYSTLMEEISARQEQLYGCPSIAASLPIKSYTEDGTA